VEEQRRDCGSNAKTKKVALQILSSHQVVNTLSTSARAAKMRETLEPLQTLESMGSNAAN